MLSEDNVLGKVTNEQFRMLSDGYNTEQRDDLAQARAVLGRNTRYVRGIHLHGRPVLYRQENSGKRAWAFKKRQDRYHGRRHRGTVGKH